MALIPFLIVVGSSALSAQAVPRADLPPAGAVRITLDPTVASWYEELREGTKRSLGWFLSGDSVNGMQISQLARLREDLAVAIGTPGVAVNLGAALLAVRADRTVLPLTIEMGLSERLSLGVRVPLVRVQTRAGFSVDSSGNLGRNPRGVVAGADATYTAFFQGFDAAVAQLRQNITAGSYGCPGSPQCASAMAFADSAAAVRDALRSAAYGGGPGDAAPFLPTAGSVVGTALGINLTRIQSQLANTWGVAGFVDPFLLPTTLATASDVQNSILGAPPGYSATALQDTRRALRYWLGDVEVETRFRVAHSRTYTATVGALARLPTGHPDSPHDFIDVSAGDAQLDLEGQLTQELRVGRLWLNAAARLGVQLAGERERRVGLVDNAMLPRAATALLTWDPGDYIAVDVAPLFRLTPNFAAGLTFGWWSQGEHRYSYRAAQDSLAIATALGVPTAASLLNGGTGYSQVRLGGAVTFAGPMVEGSFSIERVVSVTGGFAPAVTSFRVLVRAWHQLF